MTDYAVASWGDDLWPGTFFRPFASFDPFITLAQSGDRCFVFGSFSSVPTFTFPSGVTVRGAHRRARPTITVDPSGQGLVMADASNGTTFSLLVVSGGTDCIAYGSDCISCVVADCEVTDWSEHGINGADGSSGTGNIVRGIYFHDGTGDCWQCGFSHGWTVTRCVGKDVLSDGTGGTDFLAFHDSNASMNTVSYNLGVNIAPSGGKAGVSIGSIGSGGGSYVYALGNVIINCGTEGIVSLPVSGSANPKGRLIARNNIVITSESASAALVGIGHQPTGDAEIASIIENNIVYNRYAYNTASDVDTGAPSSFSLDCSASASGTPIFKNNVSLLSDETKQRHWQMTAGYISACGIAYGTDFSQALKTNLYYPANSLYFVPGSGAGTLATLQALFAAPPFNLTGLDQDSLEEDPGFQSATPEDLADFFYRSSSPLIGAGTDLSASFTTDMLGLARVAPWSIGTMRGALPFVTQERAYEAACVQVQRAGFIR